jgi:uncharacterized membrane protein
MESGYFSFCIGMIYQVSDIMTSTRINRRSRCTARFLFYSTFAFALAVNLFGSLASFR